MDEKLFKKYFADLKPRDKEGIDAMTVEKRVAVWLHSCMCKEPHCKWDYETWQRGITRKSYLARAKRLLSMFSEKEVYRLMTIVTAD